MGGGIYPSAEMQSVYSTAPVNWAPIDGTLTSITTQCTFLYLISWPLDTLYLSLQDSQKHWVENTLKLCIKGQIFLFSLIQWIYSNENCEGSAFFS